MNPLTMLDAIKLELFDEVLDTILIPLVGEDVPPADNPELSMIVHRAIMILRRYRALQYTIPELYNGGGQEEK